jgi:hypothetical protein
VSATEADSWVVVEDASTAVLTALYVRDALGIPDPGGIPELRGTGLPVVADAPDMRVAWAWTRWWMSVVEDDRPRLPVFDDDADVGFATRVRPHLDSARAWAQVVHRAHADRSAAGDQPTLDAIVAERETELGRPARPFRLRVEVVPFAAPGLWWIGENAIAVDDTTRWEPVLYADALEPVLAQLV